MNKPARPGARGPDSNSLLTEVFKRLKAQPLRCLDTETSGLDWRVNHIVGYVLAFGPAPQDSYYLPVRHRDGGNLTGLPGPQTATGWDNKLAPWEPELIKELDRPGTTTFGHNLAFDLKFLFGVGMTDFSPRFEDTMINAPLIDELQGVFGLEACARIAGVAAKKSSEIVAYLRKTFPEIVNDKDAMGHYWRLRGDDKMAVEYATGDGTSTWQLRDVQMEKIRLQETDRDGRPAPTLELVWDVESRLIPILARMTTRGIKINEKQLGWLTGHVDAMVEKLMAKFPSGFNPRSSNAVRAWMEKHNVTNWPKTPTGAPSFVKDWLEKSEPGMQIVRVRQYETLKSTFIQPMRERHLWNGRVHTDYNQLRGEEYGTITGRLSSSNPNLQAVPKHDEEMGRLFRSIFVPDGDKLWGAVDYSQCEPRLLAYYSRCKALIDGYAADPPVDAHTTASIMANKGRWETMTPAARKAYRDNIGKRINQTIITGGGMNVLVSKYGVPANEVKKVWRDYFDAMPEIGDLQRKAAAAFVRNDYVYSLLKRRARLPHHSKSYTAVNRLLQCGNADIQKLKMVEVDDYLRAADRPIDMLNNCHDALDFQFDEDNRHHFEECKNIMVDFRPGQVIELDIPMAVDSGEGFNWADATYGPRPDDKIERNKADGGG